MAAIEYEIGFVAQFWRHAREGDQTLAWRMMSAVEPSALEDAECRKLYDHLRQRFAAGRGMESLSVQGEVLGSALVDDFVFANVNEYSGIGGLDPMGFVHEVVNTDRRIRLQELLQRAAGWLGNGKGKDGGRKLAEELAFRLLSLFAPGVTEGRPQNIADIIAAELQLIRGDEPTGVTMPWHKLERAVMGPLIAGDLVGISAYSNGGKSTLAANLATIWARRGNPVLVFPTEMREQWCRRAWAAEAWVRSYVAERMQWKRNGTAGELEVYEEVVRETADWPWEVVNRSSVSPAELLAATRVLRKRWPGQTVIVIVDHLHRLDYGSDDANDAVGPATRAIKNFAADDRDGGLIFVLLYQPRKPPKDLYKPIAAHEIRGNSMVWNELDIHMSPFRAHVKVDPDKKTTWNTKGVEETGKTLFDQHGRPRISKPDDDTKLNDEHIFINVDKRRIGGEGPMVWLDFHKPSGRIYEMTEEQNA